MTMRTLREAADVLGLDEATLRMRIRRQRARGQGPLRFETDARGRILIEVDDAQPVPRSTTLRRRVAALRQLIGEATDELEKLEGELNRYLAEHRD